MGLEKILERLKTDFLPASKQRTKDYVRRHELSDYFNDKVPTNYKERFRKGLDQITDEVSREYSTELRGIIRTPIGKTSMAIAVANDLYAYASATPFDNVTALGYVTFVAKSIAELPALRRYVQKSHDWYGATKHLLLKPLRFLIPVVGPMLESGAFERMVKRRVRTEVTRRFIERYGKYEPLQKRLGDKLKQSIGESIYVIEHAPEEELVGAEA